MFNMCSEVVKLMHVEQLFQLGHSQLCAQDCPPAQRPAHQITRGTFFNQNSINHKQFTRNFLMYRQCGRQKHIVEVRRDYHIVETFVHACKILSHTQNASNYFCHQRRTNYLLKVRVMPSKQKKQKLDGQQMIGFDPLGLQLKKPPTDTGESWEFKHIYFCQQSLQWRQDLAIVCSCNPSTKLMILHLVIFKKGGKGFVKGEVLPWQRL